MSSTGTQFTGQLAAEHRRELMEEAAARRAAKTLRVERCAPAPAPARRSMRRYAARLRSRFA